MPFKSKAQIAAEKELLSTAITPETGNEISAVEKNKKNDLAAEIQHKRELLAERELTEELQKEIDQLKEKLASKPAAPDNTTIQQLQSQVDFLSKQIVGSGQGNKLMFRSPTSADVQDDAITFTARAVIYIVASYQDARGIEKLPPHKLIVFQYAASDIKKEGNEETIKNFSQYTTNLKTEIDFLRGHPYYGITFGENTNEVMAEDTKETEFKVKAANMLSVMTPELVFARAKEFNIPNWRSKSPGELKLVLAQKMTEMYKNEAKELQDDIIKRRVLASQLINKE